MELEWLGRAFQYLPLILRTALLSFGVIVLLAAQDTPFPITNCATQSGTSCSACNSGYNLSLGNGNTGCVPTVANCVIYGGTSCLTCLQGYNLIGPPIFGLASSTTSCQNTIPNNCQKQNSTGCLVCNTGYTLLNSQCLTIVPGCTTYNGTNLITSCQTCSAAYFLYGIGTSLTLCGKLMPNCIGYSLGLCSSCSPGFSLSNSQCVKSIANCATYNNMACTVCASGFSPSGLSCVPNNPHCGIYNGTSCYSCTSGYSFSNSLCVANICYSIFG